MRLRIISGGQTGTDIGALRAAKAAGLETGGWMPKGWLTEDRPRPEYAELYDLREMPSSAYPARTRKNVEISDAVLWFGNPHSRGGVCTLGAAAARDKDGLVVATKADPSEIVVWLARVKPRFLMVAGNRESKSPGIGERVETFMAAVFRLLESPPQ